MNMFYSKYVMSEYNRIQNSLPQKWPPFFSESYIRKHRRPHTRDIRQNLTWYRPFLLIGWSVVLPLWSRLKWDICGSQWINLKFTIYIQGPQRKHCKYFGDFQKLPLAPPAGHLSTSTWIGTKFGSVFHLFQKISCNNLKIISWLFI